MANRLHNLASVTATENIGAQGVQARKENLESEYFVNLVAVNPELSAKVPPNSKRIGPQCHHGQNGPILSFQQDIFQEMRKGQTFCASIRTVRKA